MSEFDIAPQKLGHFVSLDNLGDLVVLAYDRKAQVLRFDEAICYPEKQARICNLQDDRTRSAGTPTPLLP